MEIKINLSQIFGDPQQEETCHPSLSSSFQMSQSSSNPQLDLKYHLDTAIFDQEGLRIDQASTGSHPLHSQQSSIITRDLYREDSRIHHPGQRLYYDSKNTLARKKQEIDRIKLEAVMQENREATFKPKINKNSHKMTVKNRAGTHKPKQSQQIKPLHVRKEESQIKECTFKPQLIAKSHKHLPKSKEQLFNQLYHEAKVKAIKAKLKAQESEESNSPTRYPKKGTKKDFDDFLKRNSQFADRLKKKKQQKVSIAQTFDQKTGHKLFTPRISSKINPMNSSHSSLRAQGLLSVKSAQKIQSFPTASIFGKHHFDAEDNSEGQRQIISMKNYKIQVSPNNELESYASSVNTPTKLFVDQVSQFSVSLPDQAQIAADQAKENEAISASGEKKGKQLLNNNQKVPETLYEESQQQSSEPGSSENPIIAQEIEVGPQQAVQEPRTNKDQSENLFIFEISGAYPGPQNK